MVDYGDIMAAINKTLHEMYPKIPTYGADTVDGAKRPYFFTEVIPGKEQKGINFWKRRCNVKVTYVPYIIKQSENIKMAQDIDMKLGIVLSVKDRKLIVRDYSYDQIGNNANLLQITMGFDWFENVASPETEELMGTVELDTEIKPSTE